MLKDSIFMNITHVHRFSQLNFIELDRDSDHTLRMQLYILELYNALGDIIPLKDLVYRTLVHDLDEAVMCDIPRTIKYYNEDSLKLINNIASELLLKSGVSSKLIEDINTAKHKGDEWDDLINYLDSYDAYNILIKEYNIQRSKYLIEPIDSSLLNLKSSFNNIKVKNKLDSKILDYLNLEMGELLDEYYSIFGK